MRTPSGRVVAVLASLLVPVAASAGECFATGYLGLTAARVNPSGRLVGEVDARGCDVGVFIDRDQVAIAGAEIHGAGLAGVLALGDGSVRVGIEDSVIHHLGPGATAVVLIDAGAALSGSRLAAGAAGALRLEGALARVIAVGNEFVAGDPRHLAGAVRTGSGAATLRANAARTARPGRREQMEEDPVPGAASAGFPVPAAAESVTFGALAPSAAAEPTAL